MHGRRDGCMDGRVIRIEEGWMDGWMDVKMEGWAEVIRIEDWIEGWRD